VQRRALRAAIRTALVWRRKALQARPEPGLNRTLVKALAKDALEVARKLKRTHRGLYEADAKAFRGTVTRAITRVFRLKPGPKADERIAQAARKRARGVPWPELYAKYIPRHSSAPAYYRPLLEGGFQRKVNHYLQRHPLLRRRGQKSGADGTTAKQLPPDCT